MKTSLILAGLAGSLVMAAAADAQHRGPGGHGGRHGGAHRAMMMLHAADANGDNNITRAEVESLQAEMFEWMDRNGDGVLSSEDRSPMQQRMAAIHAERMSEGGEGRRGHHGGRGGRRHEARDANGDGQISRDEFMGGENAIFARLDSNEDDVITPDELDAAVENARDRREGRRFWWRD
ncbi:hypothetical protein V0U79_11900 [Hyphobacterium sp. HN65]|uniref:EF-hand domain-containing protein n=1 Tax=Hyphobacterium lacteum TaxID=3116575 RepID=A0ABU7LT13_9PROT|nr:hypothetical protein [Hyphobacterium sp. HN65]MEE2527073.1 hypothetical protein [Hyphobacterium sp. HN65]